jgi:hypothetical protein
LQKFSACLIAGRTSNADANTFGIMIFVADTKAEANEIMMRDLAIAQGGLLLSYFRSVSLLDVCA